MSSISQGQLYQRTEFVQSYNLNKVFEKINFYVIVILLKQSAGLFTVTLK